jgi:hypothetical protein
MAMMDGSNECHTNVDSQTYYILLIIKEYPVFDWHEMWYFTFIFLISYNISWI